MTTRPCHVCNGAGEVPLEDYLEDVLAVCKSERTPQSIGLEFDMSPQAVNNLLRKLQRYGLVTRRATKNPGGGRAYLYKAVS